MLLGDTPKWLQDSPNSEAWEIVGDSQAMRTVMTKIEKVAHVPRPVLVLGPRGTPEGAFKNNAKPYGDGDVIGCGYDPTSKHVFFTRNGALVSHCASAVVPRQYYPCVALLGLGTSVELNFAGPFRFAIEGWTNRGADECEEIDSTRKKLFNED